jgi:ABC-type glutathione transport system ATPase component
MTDRDILSCDDVRKHFDEAGQRLEVLTGVNLAIGHGETVAIVGSSGSGKTTLLQILGGLDLPSSGTVRLAGQSLASLSDSARGMLRNRSPRHRRKHANCSNAWGWARGSATGPGSSRGGSASARPLRVRW